jgi:hypothetical protein
MRRTALVSGPLRGKERPDDREYASEINVSVLKATWNYQYAPIGRASGLRSD